MQRTCLKCGLVNEDAEGMDSDACPTCGAIYSKVEKQALEAATRRLQPKPQRSSRDWSMLVWILVCVGGLISIFLIGVILVGIHALIGGISHLMERQGSGA